MNLYLKQSTYYEFHNAMRRNQCSPLQFWCHQTIQQQLFQDYPPPFFSVCILSKFCSWVNDISFWQTFRKISNSSKLIFLYSLFCCFTRNCIFRVESFSLAVRMYVSNSPIGRKKERKKEIPDIPWGLSMKFPWIQLKVKIWNWFLMVLFLVDFVFSCLYFGFLFLTLISWSELPPSCLKSQNGPNTPERYACCCQICH